MDELRPSRFATIAEDNYLKTIVADSEDQAMEDAKNRLNGCGFKVVGVYKLIKVFTFDYKVEEIE